MKTDVAESSTFHKLATTREEPAYIKALASPVNPSPLISLPKAVRQPLSTTISAFRFRLKISGMEMIPFAGLPLGSTRDKTTAEASGFESSTMACVARCKYVYADN